MRVFWTATAETARREIITYIAQDNSNAALRMDDLFFEAVDHLKNHPFMGKPGILAGTRELIPHPSYRLVYEVEQDAIFIIALVHTSRLWP